ncbi:MAG: 50S ribosomal protein L34 [Planctomycetota bacterium]
MKVKRRNSKLKRRKMTGFRYRKKTKGGRKIIKRRIAEKGKFVVG